VCVCVCLSVCLSVSISPDPDARSLLTFCACSYGCGSILLWQCESTPMGRGNFGVFFPANSIAFGTHTKTAEPIEMPFKMMVRVGPRYHVLDGTLGREGDCGIAQCGRSLISTIALFCNLIICSNKCFFKE